MGFPTRTGRAYKLIKLEDELRFVIDLQLHACMSQAGSSTHARLLQQRQAARSAQAKPVTATPLHRITAKRSQTLIGRINEIQVLSTRQSIHPTSYY